MIKTGEIAEREAILRAADAMCLAAKTAPKASGRDTIRAAVITDEDKDRLAAKMKELGEKTGVPIFERDSMNVANSTAVVIIGCKNEPYGMAGCTLCDTCQAAEGNWGHCVYNVTDLGIAVGSAVSIAADNRVDNRVMFTIGQAAMALQLLGDYCDVIWGIPLYAGSKSVFFDRAPGSTVDLK